MPGTMTRLTRNTASARALRPDRPAGPGDNNLARKHVAVLGMDSSPYVTGFPRFTSSLLGLLEERVGLVGQPLLAPLCGVPDLVIAVLPGPGAAGAAVQLANQHDVPLLVVVEGETTPPAPDAVTVGARLAAKLEATLLARATRWAVTGPAARSRLLRLGVNGDAIDELPYWVRPATERAPDAERRAARRLLGWADGFLVVCPVGVDTTGPAALLTAGRHLLARGSDARLVLVGRGPRFRALTTGAEPAANVEVLEIADREYPAALIAADLLLITEAEDKPDPATAGRFAACLAAGRPLVAAVCTDGRLAPDLARAEGTVVTAPPQCPEQLADAIEILRDAPQARAVMSAAARYYTRCALASTAAGAALDGILLRTLGQDPDAARWGWGR